MPKVIENPHVALNNARNLRKNTPVGRARTPLRAKSGRLGDPSLPLGVADKKLLVAYIKARRTRAECDEFLAGNKADVFDILGKLPGGNFTQSNAMLYRADAISYKYPDDIIQMELRLTGYKKLAQISGTATQIVKGCVKFEALG